MTELEMFKEHQKKYAYEFKQRLTDPHERDAALEESKKRLVRAGIIDDSGEFSTRYRQ